MNETVSLLLLSILRFSFTAARKQIKAMLSTSTTWFAFTCPDL